MELQSATIPPAAPAPAAPAPPAPTPAPTPAPAAPMPNSSSSGGGGSIMESFKSLNLVEVLFGALGATALYYVIYYYKYNTFNNKQLTTEIQNKVDDLSMKVSDISSSLEANAASAANPVIF